MEILEKGVVVEGVGVAFLCKLFQNVGPVIGLALTTLP